MKFPLLLLFLLQLTPLCGAETYHLSPKDDWFALLHGGGLKPGDEVVLSAGTYTHAKRLEMKHVGTPEKPIVIRGAEGARPVIRRPDARQNTINMAGCRHLELRGFDITGGDAAIRIYRDGDRQAGFLTFENLHIHHIDGVAITANNEGCVYEKLIFRHNEIHHTGGHGEAFYLGGNNDAKGTTTSVVHDSIVEKNLIIHHGSGSGIRISKPDAGAFSGPILVKGNTLFGKSPLRLPAKDALLTIEKNEIRTGRAKGYPDAYLRNYQREVRKFSLKELPKMD